MFCKYFAYPVHKINLKLFKLAELLRFHKRIAFIAFFPYLIAFERLIAADMEKLGIKQRTDFPEKTVQKLENSFVACAHNCIINSGSIRYLKLFAVTGKFGNRRNNCHSVTGHVNFGYYLNTQICRVLYNIFYFILRVVMCVIAVITLKAQPRMNKVARFTGGTYVIQLRIQL